MNECVVALFRAVEIRRTLIRVSGGGIVAVAAAAATGGLAFESVFGQVPQSLNGAPVQVQPYVPEPGVPLITVTPGTPFLIGAGTGSGDGTEIGGEGTGDTSSVTGGGGVGESGSESVGSSTALAAMLGTAWGAAAVANAQTVGVNASALAATCVLESGCQNVGGSGAQGVFQMYPAAFNEGLQTAFAANPSPCCRSFRPCGCTSPSSSRQRCADAGTFSASRSPGYSPACSRHSYWRRTPRRRRYSSARRWWWWSRSAPRSRCCTAGDPGPARDFHRGDARAGLTKRRDLS